MKTFKQFLLSEQNSLEANFYNQGQEYWITPVSWPSDLQPPPPPNPNPYNPLTANRRPEGVPPGYFIGEPADPSQLPEYWLIDPIIFGEPFLIPYHP